MRKRLPTKPSRGRANFALLDAMTEEDIMRTSPPELADLPDDFWDDAELVPPIVKEPISIRVDEDILEWFRQRGPRYQSRMNAVLRSYVSAMKKTSQNRRKKLGDAK